MRLLLYRMSIIDWQNDRNYLNQNDTNPPPSKTLEDVYNWHLSRDEQDMYDEFGALYYNVGPDAANRFAHYANLNPLKKLIENETVPPMFHQIRVPVGNDKTELVLKPGAKVALPFKLHPFWKSKYYTLNTNEKKFFASWYTIEKNLFYRKAEKIHEHRLLYVKNQELYEDVLATMLALPPMKFDREKRPVYTKYYGHMAEIEVSEVFQNWYKAYSTDQIEASIAYFDNNIIQLLPVISHVFTVRENKEKKRAKDTRELSLVLVRMNANTNQEFGRSWAGNAEAKGLIGMARKSTSFDDAMWYRNYNITKSESTGALYDFGPGLLQYDKDIGPLHNHYISDNIYHNKGVSKKPSEVGSVKDGCKPPGAFCYKT